jgi:hypothetical protein
MSSSPMNDPPDRLIADLVQNTTQGTEDDRGD